MKKAKSVHEFLPIYDRHIFYGNSVDAIKASIAKHFKKGEVDIDEIFDGVNCEGFASPIFCIENEDRIRGFIMYVKDDASIGTVGHEACHLVNMVFLYLGLELDDSNDEAQAYLLGYLVERFMTLIRGYKAPKKTKGKK